MRFDHGGQLSRRLLVAQVHLAAGQSSMAAISATQQHVSEGPEHTLARGLSVSQFQQVGAEILGHSGMGTPAFSLKRDLRGTDGIQSFHPMQRVVGMLISLGFQL